MGRNPTKKHGAGAHPSKQHGAGAQPRNMGPEPTQAARGRSPPKQPRAGAHPSSTGPGRSPPKNKRGAGAEQETWCRHNPVKTERKPCKPNIRAAFTLALKACKAGMAVGGNGSSRCLGFRVYGYGAGASRR